MSRVASNGSGSPVLTCPKGHPWDAGQVSINWAPCDCPVSPVSPGHGHLVVHCSRPGCTETWQTNADVLIEVIMDRGRTAAADHGISRAMTALDTAWTLLRQAPEHHLLLLKPSHPSATRIAQLGSWIQNCVTAIDEAQRLKALITHSDEVANVEEMAAGMASVVDSFHMYASLLERFRGTKDAATGLAKQSEPLAAVADDQRVLLACRAALRRSMQQLISAL